MNKSLLTYYIFVLVFICISLYIFLFVDAQVYHLPKEEDAENEYVEIAVSETKKQNDIKADIHESHEKPNNQDTENKRVSLGEFKLTAYCPCEICCGEFAYNRPNGVVYGSIGEELKEGYSIAVDPSVIPYGTEVMINGNIYKAQDCGGAIKGNKIDVYFDNHNEALKFGVQYAEIFSTTTFAVDK